MNIYFLSTAKLFVLPSVQLKEAETDPLLHVETGTMKLNELPVSKGTVWDANKDLRA